MTPCVAAKGRSFVGASNYYLHDKKAQTAERVEWTHTHNLATQDAEKAFRRMAYTAMHSEDLKRRAGVSMSGRKRTSGEVYSYSLAWHPEQDPEREHMLDCALASLDFLGLSEHEAVFVAHNDTAHRHVHVIANLIHPQTGKASNPYKDHLKFSEWAEGYEREHGKIYCDQRVQNNERRREDREYVKHREAKASRARQVEFLYGAAKDGNQFASSLENAGYTLAKGDKRGYVLVDQVGEVYSLARQLKGQRAKDIKARLASLDQTALPQAKALSDKRQHFDRDKYQAEQQDKLERAAILQDQTRDAEHRESFNDASEGWQRFKPEDYRSYADEMEEEEGRGDSSSSGSTQPQPRPQLEDTALQDYESVADKYDPYDQWQAERKEAWRRKETELKEFYKTKEKKAELARLKLELTKYEGMRGKVFKAQKAELEHQIWAIEQSQADVAGYIAEARNNLNAEFEPSKPEAYKDAEHTPAPANENEPQEPGQAGPEHERNKRGPERDLGYEM